MRKIAFICHGNICRSQMAEFMLKDYLEKNNIKDIYVDSFAVSREEIGNTIYPSAKACLIEHNVKIYQHRAKQITQADYDYFDELYYMDNSNLHYLNRLLDDKNHKLQKLLDKDVADPWYSGNFEETYKDLVEGINLILNKRS